MNADHLTLLREAIERRCQRLVEVESEDLFCRMLLSFWDYLNSNPTLKPMIDDLLQNQRASNKAQIIYHAHQHSNVGSRAIHSFEEKERMAVLAHLINELAKTPLGSMNSPIPQLHEKMRAISHLYYDDRLEQGCFRNFKSQVIQFLCDHLIETLATQQAIFGTLLRYKFRSEFYNREELARIAADTSSVVKANEVEKRLKGDLNRYLHDQGIDFIIDVPLDRGKVDYRIEPSDKRQAVLVEGKVHDGINRNEQAIIAGLGQSYQYAKDHQFPCVYYIVYNKAESELRFISDEPRIAQAVQPITEPGVVIYTIVVDICLHEETVSQREQSTIDIRKAELPFHAS